MSNGIAASASASRLSLSNFPTNPKTTLSYSPSFLNLPPKVSSDIKLKGLRISTRHDRSLAQKWVCNSSGDNESRTVLDAFFLGKAIGEALTERLESVVGEVLSTIGRIQSEQQKQVQDFQEDVLERAKQAKEKAAREAMEAQGLVSRSVTIETTSVSTVTATEASFTDSNQVSSVDKASLSSPKQSPISSIPIEE